jgi:hypothetical protein
MAQSKVSALHPASPLCVTKVAGCQEPQILRLRQRNIGAASAQDDKL